MTGWRKLFLVGAALAAGIGLAAPAAQADTSGVKIGTLTCQVSSGWGLIFGSSRDLMCTFTAPDGRVDHYRGSISRFGVDIGYRSGGVIVWGVFAPGPNVSPGALAGTFGGVGAGATFGVGLGANVLVGGSANNIALQPVSIEGQMGLNVAAGIAGLTLTADKS
jgi:hypothetical protein